MAFNDIEKKKYENIVSAYIEKIRPDQSIRTKLDISFSIKDQSIEIFELRPHFKLPDEIMQISVAKTTYVRKQNVWKIFWFRADLKWHRYEPNPEAKTLEGFIQVVEEDKWACFWG